MTNHRCWKPLSRMRAGTPPTDGIPSRENIRGQPPAGKLHLDRKLGTVCGPWTHLLFLTFDRRRSYAQGILHALFSADLSASVPGCRKRCALDFSEHPVAACPIWDHSRSAVRFCRSKFPRLQHSLELHALPGFRNLEWP